MSSKDKPTPGMKPSEVDPKNPDNAAEDQASKDDDSKGFKKPGWVDDEMPDPKK